MGWLMLAALVLAPQEAQIRTLAGESLSGSITALDDQQLTVATVGGPRVVPTKDLLGVAFPARESGAATPKAWVTLKDESQLLADSYTVMGTEAQVTLPSGITLVIPTRLIAHVRFREQNSVAAAQWAEFVKSDRAADLLVVRKKEALDFHSGVIREVTDDVIQFELEGETLRVKRTKADGLIYHDSGRTPLGATRGIMTDAAGSQWHLASLQLDGENLRLRTAAGVEITQPLGSVARIDFSQGNLQYLSELKPEAVNWTPYFGEAKVSSAAQLFFQPRMDRSPDDGPLRLGGNTYNKGIAAHSRAELTYRLPDKFRSFQALAGIDDRLRPAGNIRLTIFGDDRQLFDETLSGKDAPRPLELDITGVNRLKLIVDFGDDLDLGDWLDLCEARILK